MKTLIKVVIITALVFIGCSRSNSVEPPAPTGACIFLASTLQCVSDVTYDECESLGGNWHEGEECPNIYQPPPRN